MKEDKLPIWVLIPLIVVTAVVCLAMLVVVAKVSARGWSWVIRNQQNMWEGRSYYCTELKKIVEAEPIYEDNGKYEDEAYKVKYEDGSVGLVDNATMQSGQYCVSEQWIKNSEARQKGYILKP